MMTDSEQRWRLSADGNTLAVGAPLDDTGGSDYGAVYILSLGGGAWGTFATQRRKIHSTTAGNFGMAVALSGNGKKLAVGVPGADAGGTDKGAIRLYMLNNSYVARLTGAYDGSYLSLSTGEQFGTSVALNDYGDKLAVGASSYDSQKGRVHLFTVTEGSSRNNWGESLIKPTIATVGNTITGVSLSSGDAFGRSVALSNDGSKLVIGAPDDDTGGSNYGATYIFSVGGSTWGDTVSLNRKIANGAGVTLTQTAQFGLSVALTGDGYRLAVGAPQIDGSDGDDDEGAVYLFHLVTDNVTPIIQQLDAGTNLKIVASNDITIDSDIITTKGTGKLSIIAGRSIIVSNDMKIKGGLVLTANNTADISDGNNDDGKLDVSDRTQAKQKSPLPQAKPYLGAITICSSKCLRVKAAVPPTKPKPAKSPSGKQQENGSALSTQDRQIQVLPLRIHKSSF